MKCQYFKNIIKTKTTAKTKIMSDFLKHATSIYDKSGLHDLWGDNFFKEILVFMKLLYHSNKVFIKSDFKQVRLFVNENKALIFFIFF